MLNGEDMRRKPFIEYKAALRKLLRQNEDIQYVAHIKGGGAKMFQAVCKLGLEGIVSKKLDAPYRSGPSKTWIKVKNPKAPAAARAFDGTFEPCAHAVGQKNYYPCHPTVARRRRSLGLSIG
jgi:hypothetical protein